MQKCTSVSIFCHYEKKLKFYWMKILWSAFRKLQNLVQGRTRNSVQNRWWSEFFFDVSHTHTRIWYTEIFVRFCSRTLQTIIYNSDNLLCTIGLHCAHAKFKIVFNVLNVCHTQTNNHSFIHSTHSFTHSHIYKLYTYIQIHIKL